MKRRDFLKLSLLSLMPKVGFANELNDYKALVVVYLNGGNDSLNMFVPIGEGSKGYEYYAKARDSIRVKDNELSLGDGEVLELGSGDANPYYSNGNLRDSYLKGFYAHRDLGIGTNAVMPEIAHLINQKKVAVISNAGNLIMPATKDELKNSKKPTPPFLFAHNFQRTLMFDGESSVLNYTGWAGRVNDLLKDVNNSDIYSMNVSLSGLTHLFDGRNTQPLMLPSYGVVTYRSRLNREMFEAFLSAPASDEIGSYYKNLRKHTLTMQDVLYNDFNNAYSFNATNAYGLKVFSTPSAATLGERWRTTSLSLQKPLKAVAKWIDVGIKRGMKRQIFYVSMGGYDTHSDQNKKHSSLLRGLSYSLGDFYLALQELGIEDKVTIMVISEFGRSLGENGDGSDHAWGASFFTLGGSVKGGRYGELVDLTLGGEDDYTNKGRFIPKISFTQYYATVLKWFGLDESQLNLVLPELKNFEVKDLGFLA